MQTDKITNELLIEYKNMAKDHSLDYQKRSIFNTSKKRLENIIQILLAQGIKFNHKTYADVGCSNGYITSYISEQFHPKASYGFDIVESNLSIARKKYPQIEFQVFNLNQVHDLSNQYDIVTCFETLEHVGNLSIAIDNLLQLKKSNGILLMAVPIEIGWGGIMRVFWRTIRYGYQSNVCFNEFSPHKNLFLKYIFLLVTGKKISQLRNQKDHWSTHFGFDYRDIDEYLGQNSIGFEAINKDMTRFYIVK